MIIAVVNLKGGTGKTTTAMALAAEAVGAGRTARVLDADPQGSSSLWAELAEDEGVDLGFEVAPANKTTLARLRGREHTDFTFIDCPPSGSVADSAVDACDFAIVPTTPSAADLQQSYVTAGTLDANGKAHALLVTMSDPRTRSFRSTMRAIEENGVSSFDTVIPRREDIKNSFGHGASGLPGYAEAYRELEGALS